MFWGLWWPGRCLKEDHCCSIFLSPAPQCSPSSVALTLRSLAEQSPVRLLDALDEKLEASPHPPPHGGGLILQRSRLERLGLGLTAVRPCCVALSLRLGFLICQEELQGAPAAQGRGEDSVRA